MSLNSVVNRLVRAAASVPLDITDEDLDAHVARLLADEAKANELKWSELGLGAFIGSSSSRDSPDPSQPRPNKRFLASVIRTVDGHNSALIRAQTQAARDARDARLGESSRSRGTGSGAGGAASRLFGGAMRGVGRDAGRKADREKGARVSRDEQEARRDVGRGERDVGRGERSYRRQGDSDDEYDRHRDRRGTDRDGSERINRDGRDSRARDNRRETDTYDKRRSDRQDDRYDRSDKKEKESRLEMTRDERRREDRHRQESADGEDRRDRRRRDRQREVPVPRVRSRSRSPEPTSQRPLIPPPHSPSPPRSPSLSLSPGPASVPISRMDKYFAQEYDPRLDVGSVPAQGLVTAVGWDNMLAVLKDRGKKRRHHSPGLSASPEPVARRPDNDVVRRAERAERKTHRRRRAGGDSSEDDGERRRERRKKDKDRERDKDKDKLNGEGKGLLEMDYVKKGAVREWDVGK